MHRTLRTPLLFAACLLGALSGHANNIQIANSALVGNTGTSVQVQFDLSWQNSWRGGAVTNWDAAWVFVKCRTAPTGNWSHALLNNVGHVAPSGSQIDLGLRMPSAAYDATSNPVVGVFIHRSAGGNGTFTMTSVQLQWNFAAQGLNYSDITQVQVFAIEMVYVPQGAFTVGNSGTETNRFLNTTINTAAATTAPLQAGSTGYFGGYPLSGNAPSSNAWPNGFNAFYCMKYEVTQQGYVDFLNTLNYLQQDGRTANSPTNPPGTGALVTGNTNRNGIDIQTSGVASTTPAVYACNLDGDGVYGEATDGKDIACNFMGPNDLGGYLDWSGLRPMTELEFEKACRGTIAAVPNEYPWGTTSIASSANLPGTAYTLANAGANNESIATNYGTTAGNAAYAFTAAFIGGPLRVGIFAANGSNTGRVSAGATYYGIMEMGGNLWERAVTIGTLFGQDYTGIHGNGRPDVYTGDSDEVGWPTDIGQGFGFRGGTLGSPLSDVRVSDRVSATQVISNRDLNFGGRGVRTAP